MSNVVLLIGCSALADRVRRAGWSTVEADYFWRSPIDLAWVAAIVDFSIGGDTGLAVAERLRRKLVIPMILFRPENRDCVLPRFHGAEQPRGANPGPELEAMLKLCSYQTRALRANLGSGEPTTELIVDDSMIVAVVDACSRSRSRGADRAFRSQGGGDALDFTAARPVLVTEHGQTDPKTYQTHVSNHRRRRR